jgi:hypothetical protein
MAKKPKKKQVNKSGGARMTMTKLRSLDLKTTDPQELLNKEIEDIIESECKRKGYQPMELSDSFSEEKWVVSLYEKKYVARGVRP